MASPRISVVLVVAGVAVVAAAAAYYFFVLFAGQEQAQVAQTQLIEWEQRWGTARACLLGETPLANDLGDALLARRLTEDAPAGNTCAASVGRLSRPEGNNTGMGGVERAWDELEQVAKQVAKAYVSYQLAPDEPAQSEALGRALSTLQQAHATLRAQSKLPPRPEAAGPALATLTAAPLQLAGRAVDELGGRTEAGQLVGRAALGEAWFAVRLHAGAAGLVLEGSPTQPDVELASPQARWGAQTRFDQRGDTTAVQLAFGARQPDGSLAVGKPIASASSLIVGALLDGAAARAALYLSPEGITAMISSDAGARWRPTLLTPSTRGNIFPGAAAADVIWQQAAPGASRQAAGEAAAADAASAIDDEASDEDALAAQVSWQRLTAAQLPALGAPVVLPSASLVQACPAPTAPWVLVRHKFGRWVLRMDQLDAPRAHAIDELSSFAACDDDGALLTDEQGLTWMSCRAGACAPFAAAVGEGVAVMVRGAPLLVQTRGHLAAFHDGAGAPLLARLPEGAQLHALIALGDHPYVIVRPADGTLAAAGPPARQAAR